MAFRVWDGFCRGDGFDKPLPACPDAIAEVQSAGGGVYPLTLAAPDQRVTVDLIIANPRVRDRYVKVDARFSWAPGVSGGSSEMAEFDILLGTKPEINVRLPYDRWPSAGGVATFTVIERGADLSSPTQIIRELRFTQSPKS